MMPATPGTSPGTFPENHYRFTRGGGARGFTLMEMLVVIVLTGFVVAMAGHLFNLSMKMISQSQTSQAISERRAGAVKKMREDVWSAAQVKISQANRVELQPFTGQKITWQWDDSTATLTRQVDPVGPGDDAMLTYNQLGADCTFSLQQGCVTVTFEAEHRQATITMANLPTVMGGQP